MATKAGADLGWSQEIFPGLPLTSAMLPCFSCNSQGAGSEQEQQEVEAVPIWDAGAIGRGLAYCAKAWPWGMDFSFAFGHASFIGSK